MKRSLIYSITALVLVTGTALAGPLAGRANGEIRLGTDRYLVGETIQITDDIAGDLVVAAGSVHITGNVKGDVIVFARSVTIDGDVTGSVRGAAQNFNLNGSVGNKITVAGQEVQVNAGKTATAGSVAIAGQTVVLDRPLAGYALIAAQTTTLNDSVAGPVRLTTDSVTLGQGAAFPSGVTFQKVNNDEAANNSINSLRQVSQVSVIEAPVRVAPVTSATATVLGNFTTALEIIILGLVALWLLPGLMNTVTVAEKSNPWLIAIFGILGLPLYLMLSISLLFTIIMAPLGVFMLLLAPLLFVIAYLAFLINVGQSVMRRREAKTISTAGLLIIGTAVIFVINLIPLIGLIVGLFAYLVSSGVWWVLFLRRVRAIK